MIEEKINRDSIMVHYQRDKFVSVKTHDSMRFSELQSRKFQLIHNSLYYGTV